MGDARGDHLAAAGVAGHEVGLDQTRRDPGVGLDEPPIELDRRLAPRCNPEIDVVGVEHPIAQPMSPGPNAQQRDIEAASIEADQGRRTEPPQRAQHVREQVRLASLLVDRVNFDGVAGNVSITFHDTGLQSLTAGNMEVLA